MFGAGLTFENIMFISVIAFIPSIVYSILIRYVEKYDREPWGSIWIAFLWGATIAVIVVTIVRGWYYVEIPNMYPNIASDSVQFTLYGECLLIPFAAVIVKSIGLYYVKEDMEEAEDGLIYGAVIGLGFAATKNLIYGVSSSTLYGFDTYIDRIIVSSLSVVLIEAATTAVIGYGVSRITARKHTTRHNMFSVLSFFFAAVVMHIIFNLVANFGGNIFGKEHVTTIVESSLELFVAVIYSIILMSIIYIKIWRLDRLDESSQWALKGGKRYISRNSGDGYKILASPQPKYTLRHEETKRPPRATSQDLVKAGVKLKAEEVRRKYVIEDEDIIDSDEDFIIIDEDTEDEIENEEWMNL